MEIMWSLRILNTCGRESAPSDHFNGHLLDEEVLKAREVLLSICLAATNILESDP
jgi:hypothetical protein